MLLFLRSLLWTILLPGIVAGYIPWRYFGVRRENLTDSPALLALGGVTAATGIALLVTCIAEFARSGRGTLSPVDPPTHLVVRGLYRYVRNPMYVTVTMILLGEAMLIQSRDLAIYWAVFFAAANVFVIGYEEPALRRQFGAEYKTTTRAK